MATYAVRELAALAGVTVRTLHYYDELGLLTPRRRTTAGYRLYGDEELLRLQQILLYREMDVPLCDIARILDDPSFDAAQALCDHRRRLAARVDRLGRLLNTIDGTIAKLQGESPMLSDAELYEGLSPDTAERWTREARERYDPRLVVESERRMRRMSKAERQDTKADGKEITRLLAGLADLQPEDKRVQALIARHHAWIERFYPASHEVYTGLGLLYAEHPEFRAHYDAFRPGLADFLRDAMAYYGDTVLGAMS